MNQSDLPAPPGTSDDAIIDAMQQFQEAVRSGRTQDAEQAAWDFLTRISERAADNPSPELLLLDEAAGHETEGRWQEARAVYKRLLERAVAAGEPTSSYRAHASLCGLDQLLGDHQAAIEHAGSATAVARQADLRILLAMALDQQGACALRLNRPTEALSLVEEALRCMGDERLYDVQRGRCLTLRAECQRKFGDDAAAEGDLNAAWELLEPQAAIPLMAGVHSVLARWWAVKAELHAARGDGNRAVEAWDQALACRRHVASLPQGHGPYVEKALAETLDAYSQALVAAGDCEAAQPLQADRDAIHQRIGLPRPQA